MKVIYQADDGREFDNEQACLGHERWGWTCPFDNPFKAIKAAAESNKTPGDFSRVVQVLVESTQWTGMTPGNYLDDVLQEIAGVTNIVCQYLEDGTYQAAYDK